MYLFSQVFQSIKKVEIISKAYAYITFCALITDADVYVDVSEGVGNRFIPHHGISAHTLVT
jgi:hypothetical protein